MRSMKTNLDIEPQPSGQLTLQTIALPKDTNENGDIFGGWLVSQMDTACAMTATLIAKGRVVTVSMDSMNFLIPVKVGNIISFYTKVDQIGRSSIQIQTEVWISSPEEQQKQKVTDGRFVFVALDEQGNTRTIAASQKALKAFS